MNDTMELFEKMPAPEAVLKNAIPAMAAMLMVLIYNLADTFLSPRPTMTFWLRRYPLLRQCSLSLWQSELFSASAAPR